jgi:hypothetical protein
LNNAPIADIVPKETVGLPRIGVEIERTESSGQIGERFQTQARFLLNIGRNHRNGRILLGREQLLQIAFERTA